MVADEWRRLVVGVLKQSFGDELLVDVQLELIARGLQLGVESFGEHLRGQQSQLGQGARAWVCEG
eukprot:6390696-Prymnesium_polylepis.2